MAKEDVVKYAEEAIKMAKIDLRKNGCTSDKIRQLTGLVNAYTRLLTQSEIFDGVDDGKGDSGYYGRLMAAE